MKSSKSKKIGKIRICLPREEGTAASARLQRKPETLLSTSFDLNSVELADRFSHSESPFQLYFYYLLILVVQSVCAGCN
jgi:hypothetical protein